MTHSSDPASPPVNSPITFPIDTPLGLLNRFGDSAPTLVQRADRPDALTGDKSLPTLKDAFTRFDIQDGQILSFHHHYRNGDQLMNAVVAIARARGIKGLTICPSSIFPVHAPLIEALRDGTITRIVTNYMRGPLADAICAGELANPAILQSHGGRARAISTGQFEIDTAFIAAPLAHVDGSTTGRGGALACGPLGYPAVDARFAKHCVVAAHEVTQTPLDLIDIPARQVDAVIQFDHPGRIEGIQTGSTIPAETPVAKAIAQLTADAVRASGYMLDGMSLQSGAGGFSLTSVAAVGAMMTRDGIKGSFLSGGITAAHTSLLESGVFNAIYDVQCFDLEAVRSSRSNPQHHMMSALEYANPLDPQARVNALDVMLMGAVEVDLNFNVNVATGADGRILGGPGGHPDTAAGAQLSIVTTALTGGGFAKIVPQVGCVTTLGCDIDLVVTNHGIAVNPLRPRLATRLSKAGLPIISIEALAEKSASMAECPTPPRKAAYPRILVEHRSGTILDWI